MLGAKVCPPRSKRYRMKGTVLRLSLLFLAGPYICNVQDTATPIEEQKATAMASTLLVIPASDFKDDVLFHLATKYLSQYRNLELVQIAIYTDANLARDSKGKTTFHVTYEYWKREFEERARNKSICAAVVLKYGNSASLRIRHVDGQIKEIKIAGDNVFHPVVEGVALDLVHVSFTYQGFGDASQLTAHFYLTLPRRITSKEATRLAKSFFDRLGISNVDLNLREDGWFIFDTFYPYMNPFSKEERPPTLQEAAKSVEFLCTPQQDDGCFQWSLGTK